MMAGCSAPSAATGLYTGLSGSLLPRQGASAMVAARRHGLLTPLLSFFPPTFRSLEKHFCVFVLAPSACFTGKFLHPKVLKKEMMIYVLIPSFEGPAFAIILNTDNTSNIGINESNSPVF
jgi:hypothetical protein